MNKKQIGYKKGNQLDIKSQRTAIPMFQIRVVAATSVLPFEHEETQRAAGQGPGDNLRGVFSPADLLPGEEGRINCAGDIGVRRCLARSFTSLASAVHSTECKRSPE